jgi:integrase
VASIEERSGNWRVYWRQGGRDGKKQSTTWSDADNAQQAKQIVDAHHNRIGAAEVYAAVAGLTYTPPEPAKPKPPTVTEWADIWLAAKTRITPGQRGRYRAQLDNEILPRIGKLRLDEVDGATISKLLAELLNGRKRSTVTRYFACIHALFGYAVVERKIPDNPARRTDWIRDLIADDDLGEEGHVYLSRQEYEMLRDAAPEDQHALLDTLMDSGMRWSEATALDVRDVHLLARKPGIKISKAWKQNDQGRWYRGTTKGRNRRFVPIPRRLVDRLVPLVSGRPGDALLFTAPKGGRIIHSNWRSRVWLPALAGAMRCPLHPPAGAGRQVDVDELAGPRCGDNGGLRSSGRRCGALVSPGWDRCGSHLEPPATARSTCDCPTRLRQEPSIHDLRHSHVARLIAIGRSLIVISRRVGHHSITITERVYAGILPSVDDETVAAMDAEDDQLLAVTTESSELRRHHRGRRQHRVLARRPVGSGRTA